MSDPDEFPLVNIEGLVAGGRGLGRAPDGRPLFVSGAFPGDQVRVTDVSDRRTFVQARALSVVSPGPERVQPVCPVCDTCGGCDWMPLSILAQRAGKESILRQTLTRIGKLNLDAVPLTVHPAPQELRYRCRVRLQVQDGCVGFFSRQSHRLVEVDDCVVSSQPLWEAVRHVREAVRGSPEAFEHVAHAEVRVFGDEAPHPSTASVKFSLKPKKGSHHDLSSLRVAVQHLAKMMTVRIGRERAEPQTYEPYAGVRVPSPVGGFTQVNEVVNRALVGRVVEAAQAQGARRFLDLYCGSGNFSLPLLYQGLTGVGVESSREAVRAARQSAKRQGLPGEFHAESCDAFLKRGVYEPGSFDLVIIDPPRAGAKECVASVIELAAQTLIMVSCDPATLARDVGALVAGGYRLVVVEGFEMFPQTHHLETFALLQRDEFSRLSRSAAYVSGND